MRRTVLLSLAIAFLSLPVLAAEPSEPIPPPAPAVPAAAQAPSPGGHFDPAAATEAWLATLPADARTRSDDYFEGGYWLQLWEFLYGLGVAWVLLGTGLSVRMRGLADRVTRFHFVHGLVYGIQYVLAVALLGFPLALYQDYFREHQYGMSNLTFNGWLWEQTKGLGLGIVFGAIAIAVLLRILRAAPRTWWIWGTVFAIVFTIFGVIVAPIWIEPVFNTTTELTNPVVREPILSLARANGIPTSHVFVQDASKQTKRVSAHVTGFGSTMRIELNDNLLRRTSLTGIEMVMSHEMGHYVLNHVYKLLLAISVIIFVGFAFLRGAFQWAFRRWGLRWGLSGIADPAAFPLLAAVFSVYFFVMTPVLNTVVRTSEAEADIFGINASRQPDGMAEAALQLGEYRKLHPGPLEEIIFFDHPSGYNRILMAMRWKAEHLDEFRTAAPGR
ncbi:MAG TPA: M48 family metallopeptidase [Thermoanaerobaculia bacterium]|jgi:STE24 endopeptidase|nr:M48 family metallopeptidase [Thermoanaerobaculia bacterium]